jgi:hypothetical protein
MDLSDPLDTSDLDDPTTYRVEVLSAPVATRQGIEYRVGEGEEILPWEQVEFAIAAMVGEPEGVCTIVFDLLIEASEAEFRVCRLDADPAEAAIPLSIAITDHLGRERCGASVQAMVKEGSTGLWYSDVESFEAAATGLLRKR